MAILPRAARLRFQLVAITANRTVINTGYRMIYPFLPFIAAGLGVPVEAITRAIVARSLLGIAAPALGGLGDVHGRKTAMLTGIGMFAAAMGLVVLWPTYPALFISIVLAAAGKIVFDPAMQAYVGDRVSYQQRGLAIALVEMSWSGAFVLGMPLAGALIDRGGWQAPFPLLAALAFAGGLLLWRIIPSDTPLQSSRPSLWQGLGTIVRHPSALGGLAVGVLLSSSNEVVNIVYGTWMEHTFALQVAALGAYSAVIGFAELGGEGMVATLVDRIGKRRAVILGTALNAAASLALPLIGRTLPGALAGLFVLYITFEFSVVSAIAIMTEILPEARATLMAANVSAHSAGRALGAAVGPLLFGLGFRANGIMAAVMDATIIVILLTVVRQE